MHTYTFEHTMLYHITLYYSMLMCLPLVRDDLSTWRPSSTLYVCMYVCIYIYIYVWLLSLSLLVLLVYYHYSHH